jgi:hypothetical protein
MIDRYLTIILIAALLVCGGVISIYRTALAKSQASISSLKKDRDAVLLVNAAFAQQLSMLKNQRNIDAKIIADVKIQRDTATGRARSLELELADLERKDANAKSFFDTSIPDSVKRLLDKQRTGN